MCLLTLGASPAVLRPSRCSVFWAAGYFPSTIRNFDLQYKALPIREVMHYRSRLHLFQNRKKFFFINLNDFLRSAEHFIIPITVRLI